MKNEHTPGPWINEIWHDGICRIWDKNGQILIAKVPPYTYSDVLSFEEHGNIALISSAPDLLEALERIVRVASVELAGKRDDVLDRARDAIAKAKGEQ